MANRRVDFFEPVVRIYGTIRHDLVGRHDTKTKTTAEPNQTKRDIQFTYGSGRAGPRFP